MIPRNVQLSRALLAVTAASHLVIPIVLWARQDSLRAEIVAQHPDFGPATVDDSVRVALTSATVFHSLLLLLCAFLVLKLATGKPWTRRLATVSQALSILFSLVSWSTSPLFHAVVPVLGVVQLITIALLWTGSARGFFHPARVPARV
ncbi:hypothetical protein [Kribbella sp. DT2]|uniref:hypothetical protein n=1 Tax=Kribbella sp. DT2 TaxID=3393427 RepID=UPI003CFA59BD